MLCEGLGITGLVYSNFVLFNLETYLRVMVHERVSVLLDEIPNMDNPRQKIDYVQNAQDRG